MPKPDHLWDEHDVARYLQVTNYAVRKWKNQGKIGHIKLGSLVRYDPEEVRAFAERNRVHGVCSACAQSAESARVLLPGEVDPDADLYAAS